MCVCVSVISCLFTAVRVSAKPQLGWMSVDIFRIWKKNSNPHHQTLIWLCCANHCFCFHPLHPSLPRSSEMKVTLKTLQQTTFVVDIGEDETVLLPAWMLSSIASHFFFLHRRFESWKKKFRRKKDNSLMQIGSSSSIAVSKFVFCLME